MARQRKYTKEFLLERVKKSESIYGLIRACGCNPSGGMHRLLKGYLKEYGIDTSHFLGQGSNKGKTFPSKTPDDQVFCVGKSINRSTVRRRFIKQSTYICGVCGNDGNWQNRPIQLHMDHISGDHTDNRKQNLRWLCPNCHQQTITWGNTCGSVHG